jgi:hypothetical protein
MEQDITSLDKENPLTSSGTFYGFQISEFLAQDQDLLSFPSGSSPDIFSDAGLDLSTLEKEPEPPMVAIAHGGFTTEHHEKAEQLLNENLQVIGVMRQNLVESKINENMALMLRFAANLESVNKL